MPALLLYIPFNARLNPQLIDVRIQLKSFDIV